MTSKEFAILIKRLLSFGFQSQIDTGLLELHVNSLTRRQFLYWSNLKAFADDKISET